LINIHDINSSYDDLEKKLNKFLPSIYSNKVAFNFYFNFSGSLAAINVDGKLVPINFLQSPISTILEEGKIQRPFLDVCFIDLNLLTGIDTSLPNFGAWLACSKDIPNKVDKNAKASILKYGDIILSFDDIKIDNDNKLSDIIQKYLFGDEVNLDVLRNGKKVKIDLVLGEKTNVVK